LTQNRGTGSGGRRDGHSHSHASGRGGRVGPTAVVFGSGPAASAVQLWPFGPLARYPAEATDHRRGRSPLPTSLLSLPPLSSRTEPARPRVGRRGDRLLAWSTPDDGDGGE
jgi:hypothetical protein